MIRNHVMFTTILICAVSSAMAQVGAPVTEHHKVLQKEAGSWDATMKFWPAGPQGPAIESKCEEHNRMLGSGQWLVSNFKGDIGGATFEGHATFGYDMKKKKYVGTWVDNMSPNMTQMEGEYDKKTKSLIMFSTTIDPVSGEKKENKNVGKYIDDDTRTFTMSTRDAGTDGEYVKMMEITYKRKAEKK